MSSFFSYHKDNPESRIIRQAIFVIKNGGLVVYPTDSGYALGCRLGAKQALIRIQKIRQLDENHNMTLVCRDLSDLKTYAKVSNSIYYLLKTFTPGAYTFLLNANPIISKKMCHRGKKTVGVRIPSHHTALALLDALSEPLMSATLILPTAVSDYPLCEPEAIRDILGDKVDLIIDGGRCTQEPTTIVDLTGEKMKIVRVGKGDPTPFLDNKTLFD